MVRANPDFVIYDPESNTWTIFPTGDDDTANLQTVFDSASSGCTVQLVEGTYLFTSTIKALNFDGTFTGAGVGKTILQTKEKYPFDPLWITPDMFDFYQEFESTLCISDMTVRVIGDHLGVPFIDSDPGFIFLITGKYPGIFNDPSEFDLAHVNVFFERMELEGELGIFDPDNFHYNPYGANAGGLMIMGNRILPEWGLEPALYGTYSVTDCSFKNLAYGIACWEISDSSVHIRQNDLHFSAQSIMIQDVSNTITEIYRNILTGDEMIGVYHGYGSFWHYGPVPESSTVSITRNIIHCSNLAGIVVWTCPSPEGDVTTLTADISHNQLFVGGTADGIYLYDGAYRFEEIKSLNAAVSHNKIIMDTFWGGIWGYWTKDVLVLNNHISGAGIAGIYLGTTNGFFVDSCTNWLILGNNVQDVDARVTPIWLGLGSSGCTVMGGSTTTNVWNQGTNNIIVGVNNMQGNPPGPEIKEAMEQKLSIFGLPP